MSIRLKQIIAAAAALLCMLVCMQLTLGVKNGVIDQVYRQSQESLRAIEITQQITSLEFGIRYGKNLENYYNMDSVLQTILRSSSYVEGVYVLDPENVLLYQLGAELTDPSSIQVQHGAELYSTVERDGYVLMFMDIQNQDGGLAGTLMVMLDTVVMNRLIESYQQESFWQSMVILCEAFCLCLILLIRMGSIGRRRFTAFGAAVLIAFCTLGAQTVDVGIETVKLSTKVQTVTNQSVLKIGQVLQQQVEDLVEKGVPYDEMYDIYGWMQDVTDELDSIEQLDFSADGKVRATMDVSYVRQLTFRFFLSMGLELLGLGAALGVVCWLTRYLEKRVKQKAALRISMTAGGEEGNIHAMA